MLLFEWIIHDRINTVLQTLAECVRAACVRVRVHERIRERKCVCVGESKRDGVSLSDNREYRTNFHNP